MMFLAENDLWHKVGDAWVTGLLPKHHLVRFQKGRHLRVRAEDVCQRGVVLASREGGDQHVAKSQELQVIGVADHLRLRRVRGGANGVLVADTLVQEGPSFPKCKTAAYCRWRDARGTRPHIIAHVMICLGVRYFAIGFVKLVVVIAV